MHQPDHDQIVEALRTAARVVAGGGGSRTGRTALSCLVDSAVDTISGAAAGGIARIEGTAIRTTHATSDDVHALDRLQADLMEGPVLTAAEHPPANGIVLADDLGGVDAERWPHFAPAAVRSGCRSMMSVRLSLDGGRCGVLSVCSPEPGVFGAGSRLAAGLFGLQMAMLLHDPGTAAAPPGRRSSRSAVVERATGLVMERHMLDETGASRWLRHTARHDGTTVPGLARRLVDEDESHARIGDAIRATLEVVAARTPDPGPGPAPGAGPAVAGERPGLRVVHPDPDGGQRRNRKMP